jgi:hypothetical protein
MHDTRHAWQIGHADGTLQKGAASAINLHPLEDVILQALIPSLLISFAASVLTRIVLPDIELHNWPLALSSN